MFVCVSWAGRGSGDQGSGGVGFCDIFGVGSLGFLMDAFKKAEGWGLFSGGNMYGKAVNFLFLFFLLRKMK